MNTTLAYAAFIWLAFSGVMHFIADVLSQYLRGKRTPGYESTLYYGLHSTYAFSQLLFALVSLWLAWHVPDLLSRRAFVALTLVAIVGWITLCLAFIEYWQPRIPLAIFTLVFLAAIFTRPSSPQLQL